MVEEKMVMEVELIRQAFIFSAINYIITGTKIFQVLRRLDLHSDYVPTSTLHEFTISLARPPKS